MPLDIHKRQFDVTEEQLAHDLTLVKLMRSSSTPTDDVLLYQKYIEELEHMKATIDDQTRYELSSYTEPVSYADDEE